MHVIIWGILLIGLFFFNFYVFLIFLCFGIDDIYTWPKIQNTLKYPG